MALFSFSSKINLIVNNRVLFLFYFVLFVLSSVNLNAKILGDNFTKAQAGDFVVLAYQKQFTLLIIKEKTENAFILEEISAPQMSLKQINGKWQEWIKDKAPGHISWTISKMDPKTFAISSIYCPDDDTYKMADAALTFLPTLLTLELNEISPNDRKLQGPTPLPGEVDFRKPWYPPIIFNGKPVKPVIDAKRVFWPNDGSDLSGKTIDLYLPQMDAIEYFPYWVEIVAKFGKVKVRVIDSGRNIQPPTAIPTQIDSNQSASP